MNAQQIRNTPRLLKIAVLALALVLGIVIGADVAVYQATQPHPTVTVTATVPHYV